MTTPLQRRYFFLDTETTSIRGKVCELAVVETDVTGRVLHAAASLIDPEEPISPEAMGVHHITNEMVANEPTLAEYFEIHGRFLASEGAVYIGHNVNFDIDTIGRHSLDFLTPTHDRACTLRLAKAQWKDGEVANHKLQTLRYQFGLDAGSAHRALGDTLATVNLALLLCRLNNTNLDGLIQLNRRPVSPTARITFGKYKAADNGKGVRYCDLPKDYIHWLRKQSDLNPDVREVLAQL